MDPAVDAESAHFDATWAQNGIQNSGETALPDAGPDLFLEAGAILAQRGSHELVTPEKVGAVLRRAAEQAGRLLSVANARR